MSLIDFKKQSMLHNLCADYKGVWDSCKTHEDLFNLSTDSNSAEWMAKSYSEGWGLSKEYLKDQFSDFINGKYIRDKEYTSSMYVDFKGEIKGEKLTSVLILLECDVDIVIPERFPIQIHCGGKCSIRFSGKGTAYVHKHSFDTLHVNRNETNVKFRIYG